MIFETHSNNTDSTPVTDFFLNLNNHLIPKLSHVRYLGVEFDDRLNWNEHVENLYNKLRVYIGIFYKIRSKIPNSCLKILYFSMVHCHLLYAIEIYTITTKANIRRLTTLNNKILRILQFKDNRSPTIDLYKTFNTLQIDKLGTFRRLLLVHNILYNESKMPKNFQDGFFSLNSDVHNHFTRGSQNIHVDRFSTSLGKNSLKHVALNEWNSLPKHLRDITFYSQFYNKLHSHLSNSD